MFQFLCNLTNKSSGNKFALESASIQGYFGYDELIGHTVFKVMNILAIFASGIQTLTIALNDASRFAKVVQIVTDILGVMQIIRDAPKVNNL